MRCAAFDLAYCTNVHPGEGLSALHGVLGTHVAAVKARVAPKGKFGTGLRLGSTAARALVADPGAAVFAAQMMGQTGQRRGLKGGPPVLGAARSAYLGAEHSGTAERRPQPGKAKDTDV